MTTAHDYLTAIVRRARERMEPVDFEIDWADAPRRGKLYRGSGPVRLEDVPATVPAPGTFDLARLAEMLRDTYGESDRRLAIHANTDVEELPHYYGATFARGVASGGGRYPVSIYWVTGPGGPLDPGVLHYSTSQHAFSRLLTGDVTPQVRRAAGAGEGIGQFLVLGIKYWQNAFKYNSFAFHATSMDLGTVTGSWRDWAAEKGVELRPQLWFDEPALADLLGVDPADEGLVAVIPLPWTTAPADPPAPGPGTRTPRVVLRDSERSRNVLRFETVTAMQKSVTLDCVDRPDPAALGIAAPEHPAGLAEFVLPEPAVPEVTVPQALRRRRSSFGRFRSTRPMSQEHLSTLLAAGAKAGRFPCDAGHDDGLDLLTQFVFVNHVEGLPSGAYRYEPEGRRLVQITAGPPGAFLQGYYYLENYNLEQTAAVIVPALRAARVLDAVGERGYRLIGAVVGAVTQGLYLSAAGLGIGCGAALGFDNVAYMEHLGLPAGDGATVPLIIVMVGPEHGPEATYRYELP